MHTRPPTIPTRIVARCDTNPKAKAVFADSLHNLAAFSSELAPTPWSTEELRVTENMERTVRAQNFLLGACESWPERKPERPL
jgi:hypothetical protein